MARTTYGLTPAARRALRVLVLRQRKGLGPPAYRDLALSLGYSRKSVSGIDRLLTLLEQRGYIVRERYSGFTLTTAAMQEFPDERWEPGPDVHWRGERYRTFKLTGVAL